LVVEGCGGLWRRGKFHTSFYCPLIIKAGAVGLTVGGCRGQLSEGDEDGMASLLVVRQAATIFIIHRATGEG
jgi:hypothetical protein